MLEVVVTAKLYNYLMQLVGKTGLHVYYMCRATLHMLLFVVKANGMFLTCGLIWLSAKKGDKKKQRKLTLC